MTSTIHLLDEQTINQIAAGEVIENAASVVKELVENALDAGATEIAVDIAGGGKSRIRILDDGRGMSEADALLSVQRHATSKIRTVEEIGSLQTMGFRGEALASIAAVARLSILTARQADAPATLVRIEGGAICHQGSAARQRGTTIDVCDLFYNVPARRKFQKSASRDESDVLKTILLQALGHPEVAFTLQSHQKLLLSAPAQKNKPFLDALKTRVFDLLGRELSSALVPVDCSCDLFRLRGFIGEPVLSRPNRSGQHLFVNRRAVQCPLVSFLRRHGLREQP